MPAAKKHPEGDIPAEYVRFLAKLVKDSREPDETQAEIGERLGVEQTLVSRLLATIDPKKPASPRLSAHNAARIARYFKVPGPYESGKVAASLAEVNDMIPARGKAMASLSALYPRELLESLRDTPAPAGHEGWTATEWVEHLVTLKKAWDYAGQRRPVKPRT